MSSLVSKQLVEFVKGFEGFFSESYLDIVGVRTLGYGMTGAEIAGLDYVTEQQASNMLKDLLNNKYAQPIKEDLDSKGIALTQNEFDSMVSMAYNVGVDGVLGSTLYKNVCNGIRNVDTITSNFTAWSKAGGKVIEGLLRRRRKEAEMFFGSGNTIQDVATEPSNSILKEQIMSLQYNLNLDYSAKIVADGMLRKELYDNLESVGRLINKGHKSHVVLWIQQKLESWGYLNHETYKEMVYDEITFQAITELQKKWERETSGKILISNKTWNIFLENK